MAIRSRGKKGLNPQQERGPGEDDPWPVGGLVPGAVGVLQKLNPLFMDTHSNGTGGPRDKAESVALPSLSPDRPAAQQIPCALQGHLQGHTQGRGLWEAQSSWLN